MKALIVSWGTVAKVTGKMVFVSRFFVELGILGFIPLPVRVSNKLVVQLN